MVGGLHHGPPGHLPVSILKRWGGCIACALFLFGSSCSGDSNDTGGGGEAAGGASQEGCGEGYLPRTAVAVSEDATEACIDSSEAQTVDVCVVDEPQREHTYACIRRVADGRRYWTSLTRTSIPATTEWEKCSDAQKLPPPCFTGECPAYETMVLQPYVLSTCTEEWTRQAYDCGNGVWDDNCCLRKRCPNGTGCEAGEECRESFQPAFRQCWMTSSGKCDCGGSSGGPPELFCLPPL